MHAFSSLSRSVGNYRKGGKSATLSYCEDDYATQDALIKGDPIGDLEVNTK